jgi:hypothetical protein
MDALRASTAFSPGCFDHHRRDGGGDQAERAGLEHDPEKWEPVFRKDHAQTS